MSALRDALRDLPDAVFVDVLESDGEYLVVVDLPGVRADTVDVTATNGRLRVEARREKDVPREFRYLREDRALFLDAELPLLPDASAEEASGTVEKGVLELRLPKRERSSETRIRIDGDDAGPASGSGFDASPSDADDSGSSESIEPIDEGNGDDGNDGDASTGDSAGVDTDAGAADGSATDS
ncbi:molecular chaperone Hsp20 [Halobacteriales archaeon QS_8_65_32]|nr:MAG: molecular chaperone Hsp20 [Halobacteriales archaeon QS_8_65_32]